MILQPLICLPSWDLAFFFFSFFFKSHQSEKKISFPCCFIQYFCITRCVANCTVDACNLVRRAHTSSACLNKGGSASGEQTTEMESGRIVALKGNVSIKLCVYPVLPKTNPPHLNMMKRSKLISFSFECRYGSILQSVRMRGRTRLLLLLSSSINSAKTP